MNNQSTTSFRILFYWLCLLVLVLLIPAARIPFSAHPATPAESQALQLMLIAQVALSALFFPVLLPDWRVGSLVIASSLPFTLLAGFLSATPLPSLLLASGYLVLWLTGLLFWRRVLQSNKSQLLGAAILSLLTFGGPVLIYLNAEFPAGRFWAHPELFGPIPALMGSIDQYPLAWLVPAIVLVSGLLSLVISSLLKRNQSQSSG